MINYEMALSEIEMYKKAHEGLSESLKRANNIAQQFLAERDNCLKDIEQLRELNKQLTFENRNYEHENKALRLQADTYFDEWQSVKNLYTTLTDHIRTKAENNPGVSRYIDLVNYIDRLERD